MDASVWNAIWPEWQFKNVIGRGAYGVVYRAVRFIDGNEEESAIKVISLPHDEFELEQLRSEGMTEEETQNYYASMASEFYDEIQMMKTLNGSVSIVNVQDSAIVPREGEFGWNVLIRMECLTPLVEYLDGRTLTEDEVTALGIDLCRALEVCEENGILHRDIKPENIFVDKEGHFKLGDFGIAKQLEATTGAWTRVGTPFYSAPEVAEGKRYDCRVDIYSLGLVLYRLLNNGLLPFMPEKRLLTPGDRRTALERRLSGEALPAPAGASDRLARVVLKACEPKAKDRYGNAAAFREALEETKKTIVLPWWKRSGVRVAGVILAFLITGGAVFGIASESKQSNTPVILIPAESSSAEEAKLSSDEMQMSIPEPAETSRTASRNDPIVASETGKPDTVENSDTSSEIDSSAEPEESMNHTESAAAESTDDSVSSEPQTTASKPETVPSKTLTSPSVTQPVSTKPTATKPVETTSSKPAETTSSKPAETSPSKPAETSPSKPAETTTPTSSSVVDSDPPQTKCAHEQVDSYLTEGNCDVAGERIYYCLICGEMLWGETIPAPGHTFSNWMVSASPSCMFDGYQYRVCSVCGKKEQTTIPALGHSFYDWQTVSEPLCLIPGRMERICSRCGITESKATPPLGSHSFGDWTTFHEPSCSEPGCRVRTCTVCGEREERWDLPPILHSYQEKLLREATCTEAGLVQSTCSNCGDVYYREIAALGHYGTDWTTLSPPTCTEDGRVSGICARCNTVVEQTISALGHDIVDGVCRRCGEKITNPNTYRGFPFVQIQKG